MKKSILITLILVVMASILADEIHLTDGSIYYGEIICKEGEYLYIENKDTCYKINQLDIELVRYKGGIQTQLIFIKPDFRNDIPYNIKVVTPNNELKIDDSKNNLLSQNTKIDIESMTDREFELYKHNMQQQQLKEIALQTMGILRWTNGFKIASV